MTWYLFWLQLSKMDDTAWQAVLDNTKSAKGEYCRGSHLFEACVTQRSQQYGAQNIRLLQCLTGCRISGYAASVCAHQHLFCAAHHQLECKCLLIEVQIYKSTWVPCRIYLKGCWEGVYTEIYTQVYTQKIKIRYKDSSSFVHWTRTPTDVHRSEHATCCNYLDLLKWGAVRRDWPCNHSFVWRM